MKDQQDTDTNTGTSGQLVGGWQPIETAPKGEYRTRAVQTKSGPRDRKEYEPEWIWTWREDGHMTKSHWLPTEARPITQFTKREMGIMSDERDGPTPLKIPGKGRNSVNTNAKILKIFNDARDELGRAMEKCEHLFAGGRKAVGKKEP